MEQISTEHNILDGSCFENTLEHTNISGSGQRFAAKTCDRDKSVGHCRISDAGTQRDRAKRRAAKTNYPCCALHKHKRTNLNSWSMRYMQSRSRFDFGLQRERPSRLLRSSACNRTKLSSRREEHGGPNKANAGTLIHVCQWH
jgi:hypothetical protein